MKKVYKIIIIIILLVVIIFGGAFLYVDSMVKAPGTSEEITFTIETNNTPMTIFERLEEEGMIKDHTIAYYYARIFLDADFKAGDYIINSDMSLSEIVSYLSDTDNALQDTVSITFPEGDWLKDYAEKISAVTNVESEELLAYWNDEEVIRGYMDKYPFLTEEVFNEGVRYYLEGYLFPDTYEFYRDTNVEEITERFLDRTLEVYNEHIEAFEDSDLSTHEIFTLASIVQYEAGKKEGIFHPQTEDKVSEMLSALHEKVDAIAMDGGDFDIEEEIDDIKSLIFEQRKFFEASSDEKSAAIDKYLRDVLMKLDNVDLEKNSEDIKESIMNALVSLFDQISFVEESEDIKDFVEEKTDEINQNLIEVQNQLRQIASSNDDFDYSYTLQDVESDIAKLRMAINNMPGSNFESLSDDIKKIVNSVEGLESSLTQEQTADLKSDIEKLNEDILSISSRTNKLLLTSDESYKALNDGLNNFSSLVYKLEDRINYLDNTETSERLERKIDSIHSMASASANADKVFHQVLMYLGEWIDSTTENIASITDKTSEISKIKESLQELKDAVPEKTSIIDEIQNKFEEQELRIDRLEMKLEKILSTLEQKDDMMLNRKVDKIEKLISRLGTNIEKLTSYVDEE